MLLEHDGCHGNNAVLFSDGDDIITRDHVTYQLFFFLRGRCVNINFIVGIITCCFLHSITMVANDGTIQPKCVKSIDKGYTLLTKGKYTV